MIKRTVEVSTEGTHLSLAHRQLCVERNGDVLGRVPLEDLGLLMLDGPRVTVTSALLAACAEAGAAVVVCDRSHHPALLGLPFAGNTLHTQRLRVQRKVKKPLRKRLWRRIVQTLILGRRHLIGEDTPAGGVLKTLAARVRSGDPENLEAQCARRYWPVLFGPAFRREREGPAPNALLNYGYAVLRAAMARALAATGLHPALGLHHDGRANPFCLADDLVEAYRVYVDHAVRSLMDQGRDALDPAGKRQLLTVLHDPLTLPGDESSPLMVAMQRAAHSLWQCYAGEAERLLLPVFPGRHPLTIPSGPCSADTESCG